MSDETTEMTETTEADLSGPKQLREALARTQAENAELRGKLLEGAYEAIGLDPSKGLGKAIAKEYKGEPTKEALAAFAAEEYGHEVAAPPENPAEPAIHEATKVEDKIDAIATPDVPQDRAQRIAQAEANKDYATAGREKADALAAMFQRR